MKLLSGIKQICNIITFLKRLNFYNVKKIVLSFDDGRRDFYNRALPILKKYGLSSTLNVISDFVQRDSTISFPSSLYGLSKEELLSCYSSGLVEIGCHGAHHLNKKNDILQNISDLKSMGIQESCFGFASPNSVLTEQNKNEDGIGDLLEQGIILYIRSGVQIRREGYFYAALSLIDRYVHSNILFWYLNRRNVISDKENLTKIIIPSVAIFSYTRLAQIKSFINRQRDNTITILMFHSILNKKDDGYGKDSYYWDDEEFESLCSFLKGRNDIMVCKTKDLLLA